MKKQIILILLSIVAFFQTCVFGLIGAIYLELRSETVNLSNIVFMIIGLGMALTIAASLTYVAYEQTKKKK